MVIVKVNVFEVKAKLSEYLDRVIAGERVVICRHNKPVAELRAVDETRVEERPVGPLPGRPTFELPPSFFDALPDQELALWDAVGDPDHRALGSDGSHAAEPRVASRTPRRRSTRRRP